MAFDRFSTNRLNDVKKISKCKICLKSLLKRYNCLNAASTFDIHHNCAEHFLKRLCIHLDYYYSTWNRICCDWRAQAKYMYGIQVPWFKVFWNQTVTVLVISRKPEKIGNESNDMQEWQNKKTLGYKAPSQRIKSDYVKWKQAYLLINIVMKKTISFTDLGKKVIHVYILAFL